MNEKEKRADDMFACSDRERALFEAGIKMGTLYHQFVGTPFDSESIGQLEKAMAAAIRVQPYVIDAEVTIDRSVLPSGDDTYSYCSLTGTMIDAIIKVKVGDSTVVAEIRYDAELDYPLMYVSDVY